MMHYMIYIYIYDVYIRYIFIYIHICIFASYPPRKALFGEFTSIQCPNHDMRLFDGPTTRHWIQFSALVTSSDWSLQTPRVAEFPTEIQTDHVIMKRHPVWEAANSCSQKNTHWDLISIWYPFSKLAIAAFAQTVRVQTVPGMGSSLWLLYDCWVLQR